MADQIPMLGPTCRSQTLTHCVVFGIGLEIRGLPELPCLVKIATTCKTSVTKENMMAKFPSLSTPPSPMLAILALPLLATTDVLCICMAPKTIAWTRSALGCQPALKRRNETIIYENNTL